MIGLSNKIARNVIESTNEKEIVNINYVRCSDFNEEDSVFKPTWRYFISIPM